MGWLFRRGQTKDALVKRLTEGRFYEHPDTKYTQRCIAHSVRGQVLWGVFENRDADGNVTGRFIGCDLMKSQRDYGWGYKDMDEACWPYVYTCPVKFLDMVPMDKYPSAVNWEWRAEVYLRAKEAKAKRAAKKGLQVGSTVTLRETCKPRVFQVTQILAGRRGRRRVMGVDLLDRPDGTKGAGYEYRIPTQWIEKVDGQTIPDAELPPHYRAATA